MILFDHTYDANILKTYPGDGMETGLCQKKENYLGWKKLTIVNIDGHSKIGVCVNNIQMTLF